MAKTKDKKSKKKEETEEKEKDKKKELKDDVLEIRRVTRVMAGGKRFSFRVTVVVGDRDGRVGVGMGKGVDIADAIGKAKHDAEKNMIEVNLKEGRTIPHDVEIKHGAARILLKPTQEGHGLIAGGPVRTVLDLAGVKDISAKMLGNTSNKLNNARATVKALDYFKNVKVKEEDKNSKQEK